MSFTQFQLATSTPFTPSHKTLGSVVNDTPRERWTDVDYEVVYRYCCNNRGGNILNKIANLGSRRGIIKVRMDKGGL